MWFPFSRVGDVVRTYYVVIHSTFLWLPCTRVGKACWGQLLCTIFCDARTCDVHAYCDEMQDRGDIMLSLINSN